ncbi:serine/threonine-protein kinase ULK3 isoform X1 [Vespula pensylvanica]|uniref:serine/threonine-protein kinase ULK3 isoform X1 n=1 Tax=Vespula pensylvanica TaxID=30213 RepID=UPI001CBA591C|nr:serine/threonine-protein kinase ULK3 isoform X1 [Vespula pensylvanica]
MNSASVRDYTFIETIGVGSYATVYKAKRKEEPCDVVAIKCVDASKLSKSAIENLMTEISLLKILNHEHIVKMKEFFMNELRIYIVMEYCDGGDLSKFIKKRKQLPESICQRFLQQLALALKYLRDHNVCHMDLKPENLLLVRRPYLKLKLGDFGFAQYLSNTEYKFAIRGSPLYMAPEILLENKYDARIDLWSVGVIMYECLFGKAPYSSNSYKELEEKIKERRAIEIPKMPPISRECKNLLSSLLKHDLEARISFDDFFSNTFLDLEHAPSRESYQKGLKLAQEAVKKDCEKKPQEAFHLYCEALKYFIPLLINDSDPHRKEAMRLHVYDYISRAEKLKLQFKDKENSQEKKEITQQVEETECVPMTSSTKESSSPINISPGSNFHKLRILSKSTPNMADALDIGEIAVQYLSEGNYIRALEKFQSSLSVLVKMLNREPPGHRRDLLHEQVQYWMQTAESTKVLLSTRNMESVQRAADCYNEHCIIQ